MNNKGNRDLAEQSKEWIMQALFLLMHTKDFESITMKELSQKAGVDRKTVYRHFKSKQKVLQYYLDRTCQLYIDHLKEEKELTTYTISKVYFETCLQSIDFLWLLDKNNLLPFLLLAFDQYLPEIHRIFEKQRTADSSVYHSEYALSFYTGGFWNLSVKWIKEKAKKSPDEMASLVEKLLAQPL